MAVRIIGTILAIGAAGWALYSVSPNIGDLPECGTGSYFLYPMSWMVNLVIVSIVASIAASAAIALLAPGWSGVAFLALIVVEVGAAALGTFVSEAQHGCDRYRDSSYTETAIGIVLIISLVIAGIAFAVTRPGPGREAAGRAPGMPPGARLIGAFEVVGSEVAGLSRGAHVWIAIGDMDLLFLGADGAVGLRLPRDRLTADVVSWTSVLWLDGQPVARLQPIGGHAPEAIIAALERTVGAP